MLDLPVFSVQVGHAGLCPHSLWVRADPNVSQRGKSIENHKTENAHSVSCCDSLEEEIIKTKQNPKLLWLILKYNASRYTYTKILVSKDPRTFHEKICT